MRVREYIHTFKNKLSVQYSSREIEQLLFLLFDHYLGFSRADMQLQREKEVGKEEATLLQQALRELQAGRPIDYILQKTYFFGREFFIDERVLIPRPETEELVQLILEAGYGKNGNIIDIGSGSGCIPITLALEGKFKAITGLEVSSAAMEVAEINARRLKAAVNWVEMDILYHRPEGKFDLLISNPPYVTREELQSLQTHVVEHEPLIALSPEVDDPLIFYKRMLEIAPHILHTGSWICWEIHEGKGKEIEALFRDYKLKEIQLREDMYGRDRFAFARY